MFCYGIAWGGTLALKTRVFRQSDLLERWGRAFCEDTMLRTALARQGMRVAFVPSLMMVNREGCRMGGFFSGCGGSCSPRRLYHPAWPAVAVHGIGMPLLLATAAGLLAAAVATGAWPAAAWSAAGLIVYKALVAAAAGRARAWRSSPGCRAPASPPPGSARASWPAYRQPSC